MVDIELRPSRTDQPVEGFSDSRQLERTSAVIGLLVIIALAELGAVLGSQ